VAFYSLFYLLWGMTYTMNDIAYWGVLPSLSSEPGTRDSLVTIMSIFVCIGQFSKAEVTKGGISTDNINHKSFESLKQKDLYFIGECLDLTGELGGFNFQIVFAQAFICANKLNKN
jgi:hypothetical protein